MNAVIPDPAHLILRARRSDWRSQGLQGCSADRAPLAFPAHLAFPARLDEAAVSQPSLRGGSQQPKKIVLL